MLSISYRGESGVVFFSKPIRVEPDYRPALPSTPKGLYAGIGNSVSHRANIVGDSLSRSAQYNVHSVFYC